MSVYTRSGTGLSLALIACFYLTLSSAPARAECQEFKNKPKEYKRCLAYLRMAGTPSQRQAAKDQMAKDRARRNCEIKGSKKNKNEILVCDDYKSKADKAREEAAKRANRGEDGPPLKPIVVPNSGAFGAPKPPPKPASPCPPNHALSRNGNCVATAACRPGHAVSPITGQCVPGCRPGHVLSPATGRCAPGCRPGHVLSKTGACAPI